MKYYRIPILFMLLVACMLMGCKQQSVGTLEESVAPLPVETEPVIVEFTGGNACESPVISIYTDDVEIVSKEEYITAYLQITNVEEKYALDWVDVEIRGRGNATWLMEKKSYRVRFKEKVNLLGQGEGAARTWLLLANHCDQSMMRNYAAFTLADKMNGIEYASSASLVEVYLNEEYIGVYLLCEQVQVQKYRVDIEEASPEREYSGNGSEIGYLIELDQYAPQELDANYILVENIPYAIKSEIYYEEQYQYLRGYLYSVHSAIMEGSQSDVEALVDMNSCVDMYILQEYMKNMDVGWSSFYMYIKENGGKLYFGPPWDFDIAAGNDFRLDNGSWEGLYVGNAGYGYSQSNVWFINLMKQDWFRELVYRRWATVKPLIREMIREVEQTAQDNAEAIEHNYLRWDIFGKRQNVEPDQVVALDSYEKHLAYFTAWLNRRISALDECFA